MAAGGTGGLSFFSTTARLTGMSHKHAEGWLGFRPLMSDIPRFYDDTFSRKYLV